MESYEGKQVVINSIKHGNVVGLIKVVDTFNDLITVSTSKPYIVDDFEMFEITFRNTDILDLKIVESFVENESLPCKSFSAKQSSSTPTNVLSTPFSADEESKQINDLNAKINEMFKEKNKNKETKHLKKFEQSSTSPICQSTTAKSNLQNKLAHPLLKNDVTNTQHSSVQVFNHVPKIRETMYTKSSYRINQNKNNKNFDTFFNGESFEDLKNEYDFEASNKLFDKKQYQLDFENGIVVNEKKEKKHEYSQPKYKNNQNVLGDKEPVDYKEIKLQSKNSDLYFLTDERCEIPCISVEKKTEIMLNAIEQMGYSFERQAETFSINCCHLVVNILGSCTRFRLNNRRQYPTILINCGRFTVGSHAIAVARKLYNTRCVILLVIAEKKNIEDDYYFKDELKLIKQCTGVKIFKSAKQAVKGVRSVDLIINGIDRFEQEHDKFVDEVIEVCKVLSSPCMLISTSMSHFDICNDILYKYNICFVLPSVEMKQKKYGQVYLVNSGLLPVHFKECGVVYMSPFCGKSYLPLH